MALTGIFLLVLAFDLALALFLPFPEAKVHDEFAYLLQADTFVQGRLTNPTHPLWEFFESNHIIHKPTYASKYPPAQSGFLALGILLGHPLYGVWISTALAVSVIFWVLRAVVPLRWACAGTALMLFNPDVLLWNWRYWGGSVSALGGALLIGGILHLIQAGANWKNAAVAGFGMAVLSLSRPFEGAVLSLLLVSVFCWIAMRRNGDGKQVTWSIVRMGFFAVIGPVFLAYYNYRITGYAWIMPYTVHESLYAMAPIFVFSDPPQIPEYRHALMAEFNQYCFNYFQKQKVMGFFPALYAKLTEYQMLFWGGGTFLVALIPLLRIARRDLLVRSCLIALPSFLLLITGLSTYTQSHYAAPILPLIVVIVAISLAHMEGWHWQGKALGKILSWAFVLMTCCVSLIDFLEKTRSEPNRYPYQGFNRAQKLKELEQLSGEHLVIVRYSDRHIFFQEWVYNAADIDRAKVVWARDMGEEKNNALLDYFKGRQVWTLEPEQGQLLPYKKNP